MDAAPSRSAGSQRRESPPAAYAGVRPPFCKDSTADWTSPDPINVICWQPKTPGQVSQLLGIGVIRFSGLRRDL